MCATLSSCATLTTSLPTVESADDGGVDAVTELEQVDGRAVLVHVGRLVGGVRLLGTG